MKIIQISFENFVKLNYEYHKEFRYQCGSFMILLATVRTPEILGVAWISKGLLSYLSGLSQPSELIFLLL